MTDRVEITQDKAGEYRLRVKAANNEIGVVTESYTRLADARRAAKRWFPTLEVVVVPDELYDPSNEVLGDVEE